MKTKKNIFGVRCSYFDFSITQKPLLKRSRGLERDAKWKYVDKKGHNHAWRKDKITNARLNAWIDCDEDGEEINCSRWECRKCGEVLHPSNKEVTFCISQGVGVTGSFSDLIYKFQLGQTVAINRVAAKLKAKIYIHSVDCRTSGGSTRVDYGFIVVDKLEIK